MRLLHYGLKGAEKPGLIWQDKVFCLSSFATSVDEILHNPKKIEELRSAVLSGSPLGTEISLDGLRIGSPVLKPSKILCVGLNYHAHAEETNASLPPHPKIFMKATTALCGPNDDIILPPGSSHTDYEVELAIVIGKRSNYLTPEEAPSAIFGYALFNDVSEREWQKEKSGQWVKGKSFDTFAPLGPWLVPASEVPGPHSLKVWQKVNGEVRQESNTSLMIYSIATIVSHISQCMTLLPGDIIATGTPAGVGLGFSPPRFLKAGDTLQRGIEGLGEAAQRVVLYQKEANLSLKEK